MIPRKFYLHESFYKDKLKTDVLFALAQLSALFSRGIKTFNFGIYLLKDEQEIDDLNFVNLSFLEKDTKFHDQKLDYNTLIKKCLINKKEELGLGIENIKIIIGDNQSLVSSQFDKNMVILTKDALEEINVFIYQLKYYKLIKELPDWETITKRLGDSF